MIRKMERVGALFMIAISALAQAPKTAGPHKARPRATQPVDAGFLLGSAPVFKDRGCAEDYVKAEKKTGVERRKALADIVSFGCVQYTDENWVYAVQANGIATLLGAPFFDAVAVGDVDLTSLALGKDPDSFPQEFVIGFIRVSDVHRVSEGEMKRQIEAARRRALAPAPQP